MFYLYCKGQSAGNLYIYKYIEGSPETTRDTPHPTQVLLRHSVVKDIVQFYMKV